MSKCFLLKNVPFRIGGYGSRLKCMVPWAPRTPQVRSCTLNSFPTRLSPLTSPHAPSSPFPSLFVLSPIFVCIFTHFFSPSPCLHWNGWDQYNYAASFAAATRRCCDAICSPVFVVQLRFSLNAFCYLHRFVYFVSLCFLLVLISLRFLVCIRNVVVCTTIGLLVGVYDNTERS